MDLEPSYPMHLHMDSKRFEAFELETKRVHGLRQGQRQLVSHSGCPETLPRKGVLVNSCTILQLVEQSTVD